MAEYKKVFELTGKGYEYIEHERGFKAWFLNGVHHREDGPAVEYSSGAKSWYLNGERITLETESKDPKVLKLFEYMKFQEILDA